MDEVTHRPAEAVAAKPQPGLAHRIIAFPLILLLIELIVIAFIAGGFTQLARRFIAKSDGAAYFAGGAALAVVLVLTWKALQIGRAHV